MRFYYAPGGKPRGYSMSGREALGGCIIKAAVMALFLFWPAVLATQEHGSIALWGWAAEAGWLVSLAVITAAVTRGRKP